MILDKPELMFYNYIKIAAHAVQDSVSRETQNLSKSGDLP